jgi:hypothetical protein
MDSWFLFLITTLFFSPSRQVVGISTIHRNRETLFPSLGKSPSVLWTSAFLTPSASVGTPASHRGTPLKSFVNVGKFTPLQQRLVSDASRLHLVTFASFYSLIIKSKQLFLLLSNF